MIKTIWFDKEENYVEDFLVLPKRLYSKKQLIQNESEERALLSKEHVLSKYFTLYKLLAYDKECLVGRLILTQYPDDPTAYLGFFECIHDARCARALLAEAESMAKKKGLAQIVGPVDASFWIRYRMKTNLFDQQPYVSEPYNKEYYLEFFEGSGFVLQEQYLSNVFQKLPRTNFQVKKYRDRYNEFIGKGYRIVSPQKKDWDKVIGEIYHLIMELYCDFPIFKYISEEDFREIYSSYKIILDMSMVKVAYYHEEAVGFFVGMPDYKNNLYKKINLRTLLYLLLKRRRSTNYVLLYMGVSKEHYGLGKAITQTIMDHLQHKQATSIGAFIKKGKVTEYYAKEVIEKQFQYVLLCKKI